MPEETSYFYHRDDNYAITIAYKRVDNDCTTQGKWRCTVMYGASFCHPKDQFSKAVGRKIAEGRMNTRGRFLGTMAGLSEEAQTRFAIHDKILESLTWEHYTPSQFFYPPRFSSINNPRL